RLRKRRDRSRLTRDPNLRSSDQLRSNNSRIPSALWWWACRVTPGSLPVGSIRRVIRDPGRNLMRRGVLLLAIVLALPAVERGQTTGTLGGRIVDAQGLAVPGVTVTITGAQGSKNATTDA